MPPYTKMFHWRMSHLYNKELLCHDIHYPHKYDRKILIPFSKRFLSYHPPQSIVYKGVGEVTLIEQDVPTSIICMFPFSLGFKIRGFKCITT